EPADRSMVADEYGSLLAGDERSEPLANAVAGNAYGFGEYLDRRRLDEPLQFETPDASLTYHGHCHAKALGTDHHAVAVLRRAGYEVDPLDSGCCGMAGSFGYEAEHHDLSLAIGDRLRAKLDESDGSVVVAPGTSCRTQVGDFDGYERPIHPAEAVAAALDDTVHGRSAPSSGD
ncbi:MAG: (Fe-S)-binding protein, partial [Verrucomicrobiota bacterium]